MSLSRALQVALKYLMIKSIVESQHIIGKKIKFDRTLVIPIMSDIVNKSLQELKNLTITQV